MRGHRSFSEYTYAFAVTHEVTGLSPWWSTRVPIIPSLRREGRVGYDVRFELPGSFLFYQFKLSSRRSHLRLVGDERTAAPQATQLRNLAYAGIWQFWTDPRQHRLLTRLSSTFPFVYYVAPRFETEAELDRLYRARQLLSASMLVLVTSFPPPRRDTQHRHRIVGPCCDPSSVFIFSEANIAANIRWSDEMRRIGGSWPTTPPLALQIGKVWKELPGSERVKGRLLNQERTALNQAYQTALIPPPAQLADDGGAPRVRRRPAPPWETQLVAAEPLASRDELELMAKLSVAARRLDAEGIRLIVAQPSNRGLDYPLTGK